MLRLRLKFFVIIRNYDCILPNFSKSKSHLLCLNLSILFINIEIIEMPKTEPFNQYFEKYETWFTDNRYVYQSELAAVNHFIPKVEKSIEIGIGSGQFALPLKIKTGIDPSKSMIKLAKDKGLNISQAVAENLPFKNNSFDFALIVTTICFVEDIDASLKEAKRILKHNGRIIVGLVDKKSPLGRKYLKSKQDNIFYRWATFYSTDEIILHLNKIGFKNIETVQTVFGNIKNVKQVQQFCQGYGKGGFVVIKAEI